MTVYSQFTARVNMTKDVGRRELCIQLQLMWDFWGVGGEDAREILIARILNGSH